MRAAALLVLAAYRGRPRHAAVVSASLPKTEVKIRLKILFVKLSQVLVGLTEGGV